jgi:hypothetical protein
VTGPTAPIGGGGGGGGAGMQLFSPGSHTCPKAHAQLTPGEKTVVIAKFPSTIANTTAVPAAKRRIIRLIRSLLEDTPTSAAKIVRRLEHVF